MTTAERELLIELMANVDDLIKELTPGQQLKTERCRAKIQGNYRNMLEGVSGDIGSIDLWLRNNPAYNREQQELIVNALIDFKHSEHQKDQHTEEEPDEDG